MARQVLPIVGAVVGSFFPGAGTQIGYMIGSLIGNAVDPQVIKGPGIGDGVTQTSKEGVPRPIIYGVGCVAGNLIDRSPIRKWKQRTRGSKGNPVHEEERMSMTFAIRICEGPIGGLLRVWEDEKLVYDASPESQIVEESHRYAQNFRFYRGTEDQLPDPALEAIRDPGETPSYRGTAYIVFDDLDVTDRRGSVPNFRFEVVQSEGEGPVIGTDLGIITNTRVFDLNINSGEVVEYGSVSPTVAFASEFTRSNHDGSFFTSFNFSPLNPAGSLFYFYFRNEEGYSGSTVAAAPGVDPVGRLYLTAEWSKKDNTVALLWMNVDASSENFGNVYLNILGVEYYDNQGVSTPRLFLKDRKLLFNRGLGAQNWYDCKFTEDSERVIFFKSFINPDTSNPGEYIHKTDVGFVDIEDDEMSDPVLFEYDGALSGKLTVNPQDRESFSALERINFQPGGIPIHRLGLFSIGSGFSADSFVGNFLFKVVSTSQRIPVLWAKDGSGVFVSGSYAFAYGLYFCGVSGGSFSGPPSLVFSTEIENHYITRLDRFSSFGVDYIFAQAMRDSPAYTSQALIFNEDDGGELSYAIQPVETPDGGDMVGFPVFVSERDASYEEDATLRQVLTDLADRVKFDPDLLDLEEVGDTTVRGFVVAGTYEGQNVIRSLQDSFLFDPAEWDGMVRFVPRGKPVVTVIQDSDLVDEPVDELRESAREYPQRLELFYQNPDIDYAAAKAVAERLSVDYELSGSKVVEVPVTMTVDEAWQVADMQLKVAWEEAKGQVTLTLPSSFDYLTPTDCIGFFRRGIGHRLRVTEMTQQDGTLEVKAHYDRESAYRSDVVGLPVIPPTPPPSTIAGPTVFQFLNIPALIDQLDPLLHYYYGATGRSDAWHGASIQRRIDSDDFEEVSRVSTNTRMGELEDPLLYASEHYPDTTNSILVRMLREDDDLEAVSDSQLLREQNAIAIAREDGTAELIQFRDVEDLGDRLFRLSYLIRGRLNSGAGSHEAGAVLVVLDDVMSVSADPILIGQELEHRPVSFGESPENAPIYEDTWQPPLSQVEWPVAELDAHRDGDNLAIAWSPRERFGTDVNPIRSTNWQAYRVNVSDGANAVSVDVIQPNAVVDVSSMTGPITVAVSQVNRYTGAGPSTTITID